MTRIQTFTREQLEALDKESLIAIILTLQDAFVALQERVARLEAENQSLRDQLAKNSRNSSKPPSSDGYSKPSPKSLRPKGQRKTGGQPGHQGHTLEQVAQPDRIVEHPVRTCPECRTDLSSVPVEATQRRQVFDLPPVCLEVTEHRSEVKRCPGCGHRVRRTFPDEVTQPTQYGMRLRAMAAYLNVHQLLPWSRACDLLEDLFGRRPSEAFIRDACKRVAKGIAPSLAAIREGLKAAPVVHADETGLRVAGRLHWLHTVGTETLTAYESHPRRGAEGMEAMGILPDLRGTLIHDGWASYFRFDRCSHALCNAHHLRELRFLADEHGEAWAGRLASLLCEMHAEMKTARAVGGVDSWTRVCWEHRYDLLLEQGRAKHPPSQAPPSGKRGRVRQSKARNLLNRLTRYRDSVLAFIRDPSVPFDNNLSERDLRMMKTKQKVSGVFRTLSGANTFCSIRSYLSTARKNGCNALQALHDALLGQPFMPVNIKPD